MTASHGPAEHYGGSSRYMHNQIHSARGKLSWHSTPAAPGTARCGKLNCWSMTCASSQMLSANYPQRSPRPKPLSPLAAATRI